MDNTDLILAPNSEIAQEEQQLYNCQSKWSLPIPHITWFICKLYFLINQMNSDSDNAL